MAISEVEMISLSNLVVGILSPTLIPTVIETELLVQELKDITLGQIDSFIRLFLKLGKNNVMVYTAGCPFNMEAGF
jgi:hypothetical protein